MHTTFELSPTELKTSYEGEGWARLPYRLSNSATHILRERVASISKEDRPEVVKEKDSDSVRAIHGCHSFDELCASLVRHPELVRVAEELTGDAVYVYQFKVNLKKAHEGVAWPWHQDFAFWQEEDGMPNANAVNIAISLDDTHIENGPLVVIPKTHRMGLFDLPIKATDSQGWRQHVSADLTYTVNEDRAEKLIQQHGKKLILGQAGSIHAFHPSIVHSSSNNSSPDDRALLLITYNSVKNAPTNPSRPDFLVNRDTTPLAPQNDERLKLAANA